MAPCLAAWWAAGRTMVTPHTQQSHPGSLSRPPPAGPLTSSRRHATVPALPAPCSVSCHSARGNLRETRPLRAGCAEFAQARPCGVLGCAPARPRRARACVSKFGRGRLHGVAHRPGGRCAPGQHPPAALPAPRASLPASKRAAARRRASLNGAPARGMLHPAVPASVPLPRPAVVGGCSFDLLGPQRTPPFARAGWRLGRGDMHAESHRGFSNIRRAVAGCARSRRLVLAVGSVRVRRRLGPHRPLTPPILELPCAPCPTRPHTRCVLRPSPGRWASRSAPTCHVLCRVLSPRLGLTWPPLAVTPALARPHPPALAPALASPPPQPSHAPHPGMPGRRQSGPGGTWQSQEVPGEAPRRSPSRGEGRCRGALCCAACAKCVPLGGRGCARRARGRATLAGAPVSLCNGAEPRRRRARLLVR